MKRIRLAVISGPSGAGKSTAIKALEDLGFFCVDNLPVKLLPTFLALLEGSAEIDRAAVVVDVREGAFLKDFPVTFKELKSDGYNAELIYLEASDDALVKRFSETRRRHPLAAGESPLEGLALERAMLSELRDSADRIIDTTSYNVHQLKAFLKDSIALPPNRGKISVNLVSFGYRYGIPVDADMVVDARFLPNPYFIDELKPLDGTAEAVKEFVLSSDATAEFLAKLEDFLSYLIPLYWKEGKSYLTVAVGCTGGRHRSVAIVDRLASELSPENATVRRRHRDMVKS